MLRGCRYFSSKKQVSSLVMTEIVALGETGKNCGVIYLSNPSQLNALTVDMGNEFLIAIDQMKEKARRKNIHACIVTGKGDAFSAGGDLAWLKERQSTSPYLNSLIMVDFYNKFLSIRHVGVPTIAAMNGAAIGAGLCFSLACDIRIAAKTAKLGFTFPKLGIHPGMGASFLLPRVVSQQVATHLLLSGSIFSGEEGQRNGILLEAVEKDMVLSRALELASIYASNAPLSVQGCMKTLRNQKFSGLEEGLQREADSQALCYPSTDFKAGLEAVKNKSPKVIFEGWEGEVEKE